MFLRVSPSRTTTTRGVDKETEEETASLVAEAAPGMPVVSVGSSLSRVSWLIASSERLSCGATGRVEGALLEEVACQGEMGSGGWELLRSVLVAELAADGGAEGDAVKSCCSDCPGLSTLCFRRACSCRKLPPKIRLRARLAAIPPSKNHPKLRPPAGAWEDVGALARPTSPGRADRTF